MNLYQREMPYANAVWCEHLCKDTAEDHLGVTLIRSGRHRYRHKRLMSFLYRIEKAEVNSGGTTTMYNRPV